MSQIRIQQILSFNAGVIGSTLTGYTSGAGTISASDTILSAIQKINGNIAALPTGVSSVFGRTGAVVAAANDYTFAQIGSKPTTVAGYGITDVYNNTASDARYLQLSGGVLTGTLTLSADPTAALQAATKNYVDNAITGVSWTEVAVVTTGNITLSGEQTIDGYATSGSLVLVNNQTTATNNGIYVTGAGVWVRASEASTGAQIAKAAVLVKNGTLGANTQWLNTNASVTVGTTNITFAQIAGAGTYTNGTGISLTGNVFSLNASYTNTLYPSLTGSYANPSWITSLAWSKITGTPTTTAGYGITDITAQPLTGYTSGTGTISATDTILTAIQKLNGNVSAIVSGVSSVFGRTGAVVATSGDYNTSQVTENTNLYFTNARAIAATLTGYSSGTGTISATDSVLTAIQKLNGNSTLFAPLASPTFTGTPSAPTPGSNISTTQIATTAWVNTYFISQSNNITRETPSGTINGTNTTFTLANACLSGTEEVFLNGLLQTLTSDYTISGSTITFITAPFTGDTLRVSYII